MIWKYFLFGEVWYTFQLHNAVRRRSTSKIKSLRFLSRFCWLVTWPVWYSVKLVIWLYLAKFWNHQFRATFWDFGGDALWPPISSLTVNQKNFQYIHTPHLKWRVLALCRPKRERSQAACLPTQSFLRQSAADQEFSQATSGSQLSLSLLARTLLAEFISLNTWSTYHQNMRGVVG